MNRLLIKTRSMARRTGLIRLLNRLMPDRSYEEKFHEAILTSLHAGDVAWDVGANRGIYARIFGEKVGATGNVFAFEPTPDLYVELNRITADFPWVRTEPIALCDFDGTSVFVVGGAHTRNHLQRTAAEATPANSMEVPVMRGDSYWTASGITPNVVKIDVEGFEEEVLTGMEALLAAQELRAVFIEVHFSLLERRGQADSPVRIERLLRTKGLRPRWVDASHIAAQRVYNADDAASV